MMALQRDGVGAALRSLPAIDEVQLPLALSLASALLQLALSPGIITCHVVLQVEFPSDKWAAAGFWNT
jgi:hypothetical protein